MHGDTVKKPEYIYEIPLDTRYKISRNLDASKDWEKLVIAIGVFDHDELTGFRRFDTPTTSPADVVLTTWGQRNATIKDLFKKLQEIHQERSLDLLRDFVPKSFFLKTSNNWSNASVVDDRRNIQSSDCMHESDIPPPSFLNSQENSESMQKNYFQSTSDESNASVPNVKRNEFNPQAQLPKIDYNKLQKTDPNLVQSPSDSSIDSDFDLTASSQYNNNIAPHKDLSDAITNHKESKKISTAMEILNNYTYEQLSESTNQFSDRCQIGEGQFGKIYRGNLKHATVAIKCLKNSPSEMTAASEMTKERNKFLNELQSVTRYRHKNIIQIFGYSIDGPYICLIYPYMRYSLESRLFGNITLLWDKRLQILGEISKGLSFLHTKKHLEKEVVHGSVKSSNVLLDENDKAYLTDLGLAQEVTKLDTMGNFTQLSRTNLDQDMIKKRQPYLPETYFRNFQLSLSTDVFGFGVIIFELCSGHPASTVFNKSDHLWFYVRDLHKNGKNLAELIKDKRAQDWPTELWKSCLNIGIDCTNKKSERPKMEKVVDHLDALIAKQSKYKLSAASLSLSASPIPDPSLRFQFSSGQTSIQHPLYQRPPPSKPLHNMPPSIQETVISDIQIANPRKHDSSSCESQTDTRSSSTVASNGNSYTTTDTNYSNSKDEFTQASSSCLENNHHVSNIVQGESSKINSEPQLSQNEEDSFLMLEEQYYANKVKSKSHTFLNQQLDKVQNKNYNQGLSEELKNFKLSENNNISTEATAVDIEIEEEVQIESDDSLKKLLAKPRRTID